MAQNALVPRASAPLVPANQRLIREGRKFFYQVQPNDNLILIGRFFGRLPHMLDRLVKLNPEIKTPAGSFKIRIGQRLRVPAVWVYPELKRSSSALGLFDEDEDYNPDPGDETSDQADGTWQSYANSIGYADAANWSPGEVANFMGLPDCPPADDKNPSCHWAFSWGWPFVVCECAVQSHACPNGTFPVYTADGKTFIDCQSDKAGQPCKTPDGKDGTINDKGNCIPNLKGPEGSDGEDKKGGASKGTGGGQVTPGGGKVDRGKTTTGKEGTDSGGGTTDKNGSTKPPFYKNKWVIGAGVGIVVLGGAGAVAAYLDKKGKKKPVSEAA